MHSLHRSVRRRVGALLVVSAAVAACAPTYVIVPPPRDGYSARDTLHGRLKGKDVRVTFHFDTTWRVDTLTRWRTVYREGSRVDTLVVIDGGRPDGRPGPGGRRPAPRVDTVFVVVHDTVRVFEPRRPGTRVDTVRVVVHDTVRVNDPRRPGGPGTPGGPIVMPRPPAESHVDTVRIVVRDTARVVVHDTVRVGGNGGEGGRGEDRRQHPRSTMIPPGQYPPPGQCRVWIVGTPPGQQARPARCDALGQIPAGAFILFAGRVWDADYDYARSPGAADVPPEILAISRKRFP